MNKSGLHVLTMINFENCNVELWGRQSIEGIELPKYTGFEN